MRRSYDSWTPEQEDHLATLRAQGYSLKAIAASTGRSYNSVKNKVVSDHARYALPVTPPRVLASLPSATLAPPPTLEPPAPIDPVEAERERQARLRALKDERDALKEVAGEKSLRATLETIVRATAQTFAPPPPYKPRTRTSRTSTPETMVSMLSDWHAGENVSAEGMRGFNQYNDDVFRRRVDAVVDVHLSIKERLEAGGGWRYERCVLGCNGDFVSGTIHELEKHSDHDNIVWAVYATGLVLADAIRRIAAEYPRVEVFCTSGNHGRLPDARRVQQKEPTRSWDTLVYLFAREHLRNLPNVSFFIPNSYSVAFDVYGWRFLQTHGHDVKSWNSIPWYGLNRLVSNINALEAGRGTPIHYWLFAHFHNASSLPHATGESFVNGSLIGANEFALNALGKADRPQQWMLSVHPEHGVTSRWPLYAAESIGAAVRAA